MTHSSYRNAVILFVAWRIVLVALFGLLGLLVYRKTELSDLARCCSLSFLGFAAGWFFRDVQVIWSFRNGMAP